jgi:hypothetical protein
MNALRDARVHADDGLQYKGVGGEREGGREGE